MIQKPDAEYVRLVRDELCDVKVVDSYGVDMKEDIVLQIADLIERLCKATADAVSDNLSDADITVRDALYPDEVE